MAVSSCSRSNSPRLSFATATPRETSIEIGIHPPVDSLQPEALYCRADGHNTKVIIDRSRAYASAGQADNGDTKVGQYWQMRRYICWALSRGVGRATRESGWTAAGMHRNCGHCLMRARRLGSTPSSAERRALTPRSSRSASTAPHRTTATRERAAGRKRASMIYRLFSRVTRTASAVSSSTTDESLVVMDRE